MTWQSETNDNFSHDYTTKRLYEYLCRLPSFLRTQYTGCSKLKQNTTFYLYLVFHLLCSKMANVASNVQGAVFLKTYFPFPFCNFVVLRYSIYFNMHNPFRNFLVCYTFLILELIALKMAPIKKDGKRKFAKNWLFIKLHKTFSVHTVFGADNEYVLGFVPRLTVRPLQSLQFFFAKT